MIKTPYKQQAANLAQLLKIKKIRYAVICPGSRNAPLIQVFQRDRYFNCFSIVDERAAGYVAIGMAKQSGEGVAVVTTSGTATLNLGPAVAEAYYQHIPLIILTADRPPEWPPQFGNQRINQAEIYRQNSKYFYNLPGEDASSDDWEKACQIMNDYLEKGISDKSPVHFNIPLNEPLYNIITETADCNFQSEFPEKAEFSETTIEKDHSTGVHKDEAKLISETLLSDKKVLLIAGMSDYSAEEKAVLQMLTEKFQLAVIGENLANLDEVRSIGSPDTVLAAITKDQKEMLSPNLIICFGGQVVSKRTRLFVQELEHITTLAFDHLPTSLLKGIIEKAKGPGTSENTYCRQWEIQLEKISASAHDFLMQAGFCNLTAMSKILEVIPEGTIVHLGNSGSIRYSQIIPPKPGLKYYSNRGTSGIDGSVSTAVGAAMVSSQPHVLILGDLSFVYDSNGLWNNAFPKNLKIIVLNDHGGGIFRLLDGPDKMPFFEKFSVTSHPVSIKLLAEAFGLPHSLAASYTELAAQLITFFSVPDKPQLLEVDTTKSENSIIFKQFFKSIQNQ